MYVGVYVCMFLIRFLLAEPISIRFFFIRRAFFLWVTWSTFFWDGKKLFPLSQEMSSCDIPSPSPRPGGFFQYTISAGEGFQAGCIHFINCLS